VRSLKAHVRKLEERQRKGDLGISTTGRPRKYKVVAPPNEIVATYTDKIASLLEIIHALETGQVSVQNYISPESTLDNT
jgi:hypothetical protein